jgi:hypothetical protein
LSLFALNTIIIQSSCQIKKTHNSLGVIQVANMGIEKPGEVEATEDHGLVEEANGQGVDQGEQ